MSKGVLSSIRSGERDILANTGSHCVGVVLIVFEINLIHLHLVERLFCLYSAAEYTRANAGLQSGCISTRREVPTSFWMM